MLTSCWRIGLELISVRRNRTRPDAPGGRVAGSGVATILAPVTWIEAVRDSVPLVAVTVITRFERSAPTPMVAVLTPFASVVLLGTAAVALLSTAKATGTLASRLRLASTTVTVAVTLSPPLLSTVGELSTRVMSAAAGVVVLPVPVLVDPPVVPVLAQVNDRPQGSPLLPPPGASASTTARAAAPLDKRLQKRPTQRRTSDSTMPHLPGTAPQGAHRSRSVTFSVA
jgi:hypothetical protein